MDAERSPKRLGDILLEAGKITGTELEAALTLQKKQGGFLGQALVELNVIRQEDLIPFIVKQCKIPHIHLVDYQISVEVLKFIPPDVCRKYSLLPIDHMGRILTVAMVNPLDIEALDQVRLICPDHIVKPILCTHQHFEEVFQRLHPEKSKVAAMSAETLGLSQPTQRAKKSALDETVDQVIREAGPQAKPAATKKKRTSLNREETFSGITATELSTIMRETMSDTLRLFAGHVHEVIQQGPTVLSGAPSFVNQFFYTHDVHGQIVYVSPNVTRVLGYTSQEFMDAFPGSLTANPCNDVAVSSIEECLLGTHHPPYEIELLHKDQSTRCLVIANIPVFDGDEKVVAIESIAQDISERKIAEDRLIRATTHDVVTGLLKRENFLKALECAFKSSRRYGHSLCLCLYSTEQYQHATDSEEEDNNIMPQLGHMLRTSIRSEDVAGHYSDNTLGIVYPFVIAEEAIISINRIQEELLNQGIVSRDTRATSCAILSLEASHDTVQKLLKDADMALTKARKAILS
jgi:diguanylate cyclase (GGDEF)-like protein/PAS domain S-box-containing protein